MRGGEEREKKKTKKQKPTPPSSSLASVFIYPAPGHYEDPKNFLDDCGHAWNNSMECSGGDKLQLHVIIKRRLCCKGVYSDVNETRE